MPTQAFDFAKAAKKYRPKEASTAAVKVENGPITVHGKSGALIAHDGDYIVKAGEQEKTETIAPEYNDRGNKQTKPGETRVTKVPFYVVLSADEFESQYVPA